ncbi:hypothetical protein IKQ26_05075 [bacterium]|nr:hypothetical protein [bacterium]
MANSVSGSYNAAAAEEARRRAEEEARRREEERKRAEEEARKKAEQEEQARAQREEDKKAEEKRTEETRREEATAAAEEVLGTTASATTVESIFGDDFYKDDTNISAKQAITNMKNSSLYDDTVACYFDRMANAAEGLKSNESWRISMDQDGDGQTESVALADAIASSFDSELDLFIEEKVEEVVKKYGACSKQYLSEAALRELASYGIRVDAVGDDEKTTNRAYAFSLVEIPEEHKGDAYEWLYNTEEGKNAKVLEDANGKKGSYIFADCLIPDGYAQGAELNLSSILDQMGYDCVSKADFIGKESEYNKLLSEVETRLQNGEYKGGQSMNDLYGNRKDILTAVKNLWGGSGSAPGVGNYGGSSSPEDALKAKSEELRKKASQSHDAYLYRMMLINEYRAEHGTMPTGSELIKIEEKAKQMAEGSLVTV